MLGINLVSETFERLLFKTQTNSLQLKFVVPTVLCLERSQRAKKNNIIIISNGIEQKQNRTRRKKYVFSDEQFQDSTSQIISYNSHKKHLIKKQKKQDPDFSVKRQKNDRNVISNIIHHLMKHISTSIPNSELEKTLKKAQINLSIEQFFSILKEKDSQCRTYVTNKHLKSLWNDSLKPQFSRLMRILSRVFLQNYSFLTIFNGNKLNKQSKMLHYKGRRQIIQFLSKVK